MMKHLKKLSALLVALAIFFTAIPASAFYEDEEDVLNEVQETDYSSDENVDKPFELLILPQTESGTTYSSTYDEFDLYMWFESDAYNANNVTGHFAAADVNDDGKDDLLAMYEYSTLMRIHLFESTGDSFSGWYDWCVSAEDAFFASSAEGTFVTGDFDDDGYDDVAVLYDYGSYANLLVFEANGERYGNYWETQHLGEGKYLYDRAAYRLVAGDFDGDGKDTIRCVYAETEDSLAIYEWEYLGGYMYDFTDRQWNSMICVTEDGTESTTLVSSMKNGNDTLAYTYDKMGNITSISQNGTLVESYTYDALNQLKTVTRGNDVYTYNYDDGGNILSVTKNGTTIKSYSYGDSEWKDLLTAYNGQSITYDNIGNPLTYYNGSTFTWSDGRKLTNITKGSNTISYTYDSNGLRTSKTVNGTTTEYYWLDGTLYAEKTGSQYIYYHYDDNGIAYGFTVVNGTTTTDYYYIHNLQGDVIGIVDNDGTKVVEYTYDEWGKILTTTGSLATTIGTLNPFRYRGYYYDAETGFYYCRARYYDPEICRWISADDPSIIDGSTLHILENNLFAYCFNNPINMTDDTGLWPKWATKVLIGTAVIATAAILTVATAGTGTTLACFALGALKGSLIGAASGAASGAITGAVTHRIKTGSWEGAGQAALEGAADGYMTGAITGFISGGLTSNVCFVAGTSILSSVGYVAIEDIEIGDYVWASNPETGETSLKKVVQTFVNETDELIYVITNNECIITTPGHPFYVSNKGWVNAEDLKCYDSLIDNFGNTIDIIETKHVVVLNPIKVYNFEVEDYHTYFVSNDAILVHNTGCNLGKLSNSFLKRKLKIDAHEVKIEYLGKKAQISLYDLAADKNTGIIYIIDKAGKIVAETIYRTK